MYGDDQLFGPIMKSLTGKKCENPIETRRINRLIPMLTLKNGLLYYKGRLCVSRKGVRSLLHLAHDFKVAGNFAFAKTLGRLTGFHW